MDYTTSILHGIIICIPFSVFVIVSFSLNPRLWLHSLPNDIAEMVPPKTEYEKKLTRYILLPVYLVILPGLSIASVIYLSRFEQVNFSFIRLLLHIYTIWITVHLWDLLVIDGLYMLFIDPNHPPIPGTESSKGWKDYSFHTKAFIKASLFSAFFVIPAAVILFIIL